jgi:hypothetical protein
VLTERGEGFSGEPEFDIPFFEQDRGFDTADTATGPQAGRNAGAASDFGNAGRRGADEAAVEQFPPSRVDEGSETLRPVGATPEPGTPQAGEIAALALTEATPAGQQTLIDGVKPVTTRERLEAQAAKPLRGGDKPAGGMFDDTKTRQIDMWDVMPAAKKADGTVSHVTHAELLEDAQRDDMFGDLISSCKD